MKIFIVAALLAVVAAAVGMPSLDDDSIYTSAQERRDPPPGGMPGFRNNGDGSQGVGQEADFGSGGGHGQGYQPGFQQQPLPLFSNGTRRRQGWQMGSESPQFPSPFSTNGDENQGRRPRPSVPPPADGEGNQGGESGFGGVEPPSFRSNAESGQEGPQGSGGPLPPSFSNNDDSNQQRPRGFPRPLPPSRQGNRGSEGNQGSQGNRRNEEGGPEFRRRPRPSFQRGAASSADTAPGAGRRSPRGFARGDDSIEEERRIFGRARWAPRESGSASSEEERRRYRRPRSLPRESGSASSEEEVPAFGGRPQALVGRIFGGNWPLNGTRTFNIATPEMPAIGAGGPASRASQPPEVMAP